jgi:GT2 family glycosyltransferase
MDRVTAIIPNWNGGSRLPRVITDLRQQSQPPERIIVVDNGSFDGSEKQAEAAGCEVLRLPQNRGFAAAVNIGVKQVKTSLVSILNNDLELPGHWLTTLTAALGESWFATGRIWSAARRDRLDATFDLVSLGRTAWRCGSGRADGVIWQTSRPIASAPMTAALFRTDLFRRVGELDERFESYLEDVDFGIRCALAGLDGIYVPEAECWHWGSATLGVWHRETTRRIARNQVYLAAKYPPRRWLSRAGWSIVAGQLLWGMVAARHGRFLPWLRGVGQGLRSRPQRDFGRHSGREPDTIFETEQETLKMLQVASGPDVYWRLYFALTGGGRL